MTDSHWSDHHDLAVGVAFDWILSIELHMETRGITKKELARRMSRSPSYVSRLLHTRKDHSLTVLEMVRVCHALDLELTLSISAKETNT